jgi:hypothetical protein
VQNIFGAKSAFLKRGGTSCQLFTLFIGTSVSINNKRAYICHIKTATQHNAMNATLTTPAKFDRRAIAIAAWSLVKKCGATLREGMKQAWAVAKGLIVPATVAQRVASSSKVFEVWSDERPRFVASAAQEQQLRAAGVVLPADFCTLVAAQMASEMIAALSKVAQVILVVEQA